MKSFFAGTFALLACGCAHEPEIVHEAFKTPDGQSGHIVYCGGINSSMAECYEDARTICGGDYKLLNRNLSQRTVGDYASTENRSVEFTCAA